jgi:protein SCO1/2
MAQRRSWILLGAIAVLAAIGGFWLARELDSSGVVLASGTWLPGPRNIGTLSLTDHNGKPFNESNLRGKPTLVFFGFTHCPDVCPTTLAQLAQVKKAAAIPNLQVLLVSVDPARDTPESLEKYVHAFDPEFIGVTGAEKAITATTKAFGVAVAKVDLPGGNYTVDHSAAVFLLNDQGGIVAVFTPPFDTRLFAEDLKRAAPHLHSL